MIFSELYGAYYDTVAAVLKAAVSHPLEKEELRGIISAHAFGESMLAIEPALAEQRWQLIRKDGTTPLLHEPSMPPTTLELQWLKAVYADPRIRLFTDEVPDLPADLPPLFTAEDCSVFDRYSDGDPFEDENYIRNFRLILNAVRNGTPLMIETGTRKSRVIRRILMPEMLEYSEKDDKFRLIGSGCRYGGTVNLARILRCEPYTGSFRPLSGLQRRTQSVELEVADQRKALERVLLHFAHFEKQAEKLDNGLYRVTLNYDPDDETEIVIRVLSFGPMVKVTAPARFTELIRDRLLKQKSCER